MAHDRLAACCNVFTFDITPNFPFNANANIVLLCYYVSNFNRDSGSAASLRQQPDRAGEKRSPRLALAKEEHDRRISAPCPVPRAGMPAIRRRLRFFCPTEGP
jgi:hypothetical protein